VIKKLSVAHISGESRINLSFGLIKTRTLPKATMEAANTPRPDALF
jgi:hypothetical protein